MNHETMEVEIALLKQDANERRKILDDLIINQRKQTETIHAMDKKLDQVLERKECPAIGLCAELEPRLEVLERKDAEAAGGKKVLAAIVAASATCGAVVSWVMNHLNGKP